MRGLTNVIGFDDAPFPRGWRGDVRIVGCVFCRTRMDGLVSGKVRRDGANATARMAELVEGSQFSSHVRAVLLHGIGVAGFNVVDIHGLAERLGVPVLVVCRKRPDLARIRRTLLEVVPGGAKKWRLIERAGQMQRCGPVWVQRAGLDLEQAAALLDVTTLHGNIPEPLRVAHLIAGGITDGVSRGRA